MISTLRQIAGFVPSWYLFILGVITLLLANYALHLCDIERSRSSTSAPLSKLPSFEEVWFIRRQLLQTSGAAYLAWPFWSTLSDLAEAYALCFAAACVVAAAYASAALGPRTARLLQEWTARSDERTRPDTCWLAAHCLGITTHLVATALYGLALASVLM
jgi:hypothetical protein